MNIHLGVAGSTGRDDCVVEGGGTPCGGGQLAGRSTVCLKAAIWLSWCTWSTGPADHNTHSSSYADTDYYACLVYNNSINIDFLQTSTEIVRVREDYIQVVLLQISFVTNGNALASR